MTRIQLPPVPRLPRHDHVRFGPAAQRAFDVLKDALEVAYLHRRVAANIGDTSMARSMSKDAVYFRRELNHLIKEHES